ncbi:MAG: cell envelope integrity protein TolA [Leptothrix sp. (in: b-proteobacteria)]
MTSLNPPTAVTLYRPPSADGLGLGSTLALIVHAGLIAAIAWGVAWHNVPVTPISAELWSAVPQFAAPLAGEAPPPTPIPTPPPAPVPKPVPTPAPPLAARVEAPAPSRDAEIALERARQKLMQAKRDELQRLADQKKAEAKAAEDKRLQAKKAQDALEQKALEAEQAKQDAKRLADKKADDKKARAAAADKAEAERVAGQRAANLQRLSRLLGDPPSTSNAGNGPSRAGPTGSGGNGTAAQASGPSASYAGRIRAYILPKIVFTGRTDGSAVAEVEVRVAPDGSILGSRLVKPSGQADWDQAVLRAIDRTETLPRDTDGRVPSLMVLSFDTALR